MLAIQYIRMYWEKENRSPKGAIMRRDFFKPEQIDSNIKLGFEKCEYFLQKRWYVQTDKVYENTEYNKLFMNRYVNACGSTDAKRTERIHKYLLEQNIAEKNNKGVYLSSVEDIIIPGLEILNENDSYRIKWHTLQRGYQPVRTGYNEDFNNPKSVCKGQRIKNETAFVLQQGEAGLIQYNYRYTSYHGQHYEQFCIYMLHTNQLKHNSFVNALYEKRYEEMADLF
jgi:hypothetical protein